MSLFGEFFSISERKVGETGHYQSENYENLSVTHECVGVGSALSVKSIVLATLMCDGNKLLYKAFCIISLNFLLAKQKQKII